ncbi:Glutamate decarboxylase [Bremerella volcania]|uniref:Glutamate decarboxylase n=1 Tax=Bremerella volcania TaxID=2527984 RepID=A0A518C5R2_9BACT|nr:glutamate decarboxylase [Bremerella volcania]QDU74565.1 Glutamate decarboxylase [Bremerella volcania]
MLKHPKNLTNLTNLKDDDAVLQPLYGRRALTEPIPKYKLPENEMAVRTAYELIHDELMLDGNARLNLATFVTTWMEPEAEQLMAESFSKNMIDKDEYPQTAMIEERCINMVARLFHAPEEGQAIGASAIGSSEAIMLAGMALKWKWRQRRERQGKSSDRPNMVMGANVQVVWEKFCRYWEVEPRYVPMQRGHYTITPEGVVDLIDENTIGVVAILGTTFTGEFEPVEQIHEALMKRNAETGWEIPLHVDAASGGFVAPFLDPDLKWDFRLPLVKSTNVSGHKYGLVYPGVCWVVWRDEAELPRELIFHVNYLGGDMPTFTLNFSRPGNQVVAQYYNFLRLGRRLYAHHASDARHGDVSFRRDWQTRTVRIGQRWQCDSRVRIRDERPHTLHGVRSIGKTTRTRLAGARLYHAARCRGHRRVARLHSRRFQPRHGGHVPGRYS